VILEHWWQVFRGTASWLSPPFFYPAQGVLGYSEGAFLFALPYAALRFAGAGPLVSYQIVLFALVAAGWIGTILFLRRCLRLGVVPTLAGAALFVFPNSANIAAASHTQLFAIHFIPHVALGIYLFLRDFPKATSGGRVGGMIVAVLLPAIFYTSHYVGWFSLFFLLLSEAVSGAWARLHWRGSVPERHILWNRDIWKGVAPYLALSGVCFVPFVMTYGPALGQFGARRYSEMVSMLPSPIDYVNVGPTNWLWGRALCAGRGSRPLAPELVKGLPVGLLLVFLMAWLRCVRKTRPYRVDVAEDGRFCVLVEGRPINDEGRLASLSAGLGAAVLLAWLLLLRVHDLSLWWLVAKAIPGASGIRAAYRFQHVLAFPVAVVVAIALQQVLNHVRRGGHSPRKRNLQWAAVVAACLLLVVEQFNTGGVALYGKQQQRDLLARIQPPPRQAKVFALLPGTEWGRKPLETAIDAMIVAQHYGLYSINGYSGQWPRGGEGLSDTRKPEYLSHLVACRHRRVQ
jgi:hypothetical protein